MKLSYTKKNGGEYVLMTQIAMRPPFQRGGFRPYLQFIAVHMFKRIDPGAIPEKGKDYKGIVWTYVVPTERIAINTIYISLTWFGVRVGVRLPYKFKIMPKGKLYTK